MSGRRLFCRECGLSPFTGPSISPATAAGDSEVISMEEILNSGEADAPAEKPVDVSEVKEDARETAETLPTLAAELKRLRLTAGFSKSVVASRLGLGIGLPGKWEAGHIKPGSHILERLDALYGSNLVEKFGGEVKGGPKGSAVLAHTVSQSAEPVSGPKQVTGVPAATTDEDDRQPGQDYDGTWKLIVAELHRATLKHPGWPIDPVHATAILAEECGEVTKASIDYFYFGGSLILNGSGLCSVFICSGTSGLSLMMPSGLCPLKAWARR
ncbi:hypothetical protein C4J81_16555 [Deltaproteobacteria bacterium Smac51]|nr:hypothetical protein C4J81_16555 [Deltaproteobacteria bacterium Smac51]